MNIFDYLSVLVVAGVAYRLIGKKESLFIAFGLFSFAIGVMSLVGG